MNDSEYCDIIRALAGDEDDAFKRFIAWHQVDLPEECACEIIGEIARSGNRWMRHSVAEYQRNLPDECACDIIFELSNDNWASTRFFAHINPMYKKCFGDEYPWEADVY